MKHIPLQEVADWLRQCEDTYILIHRSPDGDCIGGGYALHEILRQMGKRSKVLCNDVIPSRYNFLIAPEEEDFAPKSIISVDVADPKLLGKNVLAEYGDRVDMCIDHHASHVEFAKAGYVDADAAAACQILCHLFEYLPIELNDTLATCLYTGMATDTGCFQYDNAKAETHEAVAYLMRHCPQVNYAQINRRMFAVKSMGRLKLDQMLIDRMESYLDGKCILICITQELLHASNLDEAELVSIAGFPLQVEGAEVGITMKEREDGHFRVSMRSADWVDVSAICQTLGGGGHIKAAGCSVKAPPDEARRILVEAVRQGMEKQQCQTQ